MDVAVFALILFALAGFVAAPLYRPAPSEPTREGDARREQLEVALSELELDRATGLIDEAAYEQERRAIEDDRND
jgi:cytochrome c-type biogenesis protein CcmI